MLSKYHLPFGGALCTTIFTIAKHYNHHINFEQFILGGLLGAILPDIDHNESWITQLSPIKFYKVFSHRGLTHNLLIPFSLFLAWLATKNNFLLGLSVGIFCHLASDKGYSNTKKESKLFFQQIVFCVSWLVITITVILITLGGV